MIVTLIQQVKTKIFYVKRHELLPPHVIRHRLTHTLQLGRTKGLAAEAALGDRSPDYRVKAAGWAGSIVPIATRSLRAVVSMADGVDALRGVRDCVGLRLLFRLY
ncbi:hypothetical protein Agabi119p4_3908 [Agaricus bisporus var. burnettii]|uniref:Uncharacterized protein n=1 Tax=Agaricus bisporus var. burnettii TaxID=192524 RepID=A0A8H7F5P9_AGABI|nr:hypothetical protein Agabi119p4_3908 [Agaricus bisporus var. burnettii]